MIVPYSKLFEYSYSVGIRWLCDNSHLESRRLDVWVSLTFLLVSKGLKVNSKSRKRLLQVTAGGTKFVSHPPSRIFGWRLSITHLFGSAPRQESLFHGQVCFSFSNTLILAASLCQIKLNPSSLRVVLSLRPEWCAHSLLITKDSNRISLQKNI